MGRQRLVVCRHNYCAFSCGVDGCDLNWVSFLFLWPLLNLWGWCGFCVVVVVVVGLIEEPSGLRLG